jgi:N-methylhydantoinase A
MYRSVGPETRYRITTDVGGTFTDIVVVDVQTGAMVLGKAPSTPERPIEGVRNALDDAAVGAEATTEALLERCEYFIYSTTRATNAVLERTTARTAVIVTEGFPDILTLREGGKLHPFELKVDYPTPYVPKQLTFEVAERIDAEGAVVRPLETAAAEQAARDVLAAGAEAVAVCLLWSVVNPAHELALEQALKAASPELPVTLSHRILPAAREYRRASSAAIDASLKPLMRTALEEVTRELRGAGLKGEILAATSFGGVLPLEELAARPIYSVRSGPSLAPVAARGVAMSELAAKDVVVCDTGGTSFDVSLVRDGEITRSRETWLGPRFTGEFAGISSVDVRSIGAGGGSIAWVDPGGLLRVGPRSAGAAPGPAAYGRGGEEPTVTDAAVVLGWIDPERFLGGRMRLDVDAARAVLASLATQIGLESPEAAAEAVIAVASEYMVGAIREITINEGIDVRESLILGGGGACGLNIATIAAALDCPRVLMPRTAGALSASGGQHSDIVAEFSAARYTTTEDFDFEGVNAALAEVRAQAQAFAERLTVDGEVRIDYFTEARYAYQAWELEVPLQDGVIDGEGGLADLRSAFDQAHQRVFSVVHPGAAIETLAWRARLAVAPGGAELPKQLATGAPSSSQTVRPAFFAGAWQDARIIGPGELEPDSRAEGPLLIVEPTSTTVVPPGASVSATSNGHYLLEISPR